MNNLTAAYKQTIKTAIGPLQKRRDQIRIQRMKLLDNKAMSEAELQQCLDQLIQKSGPLDTYTAIADSITLAERHMETLETMSRRIARMIEQRGQYKSIIASIANIRKRADLWVLRLNSRPADYIKERVPQLLRYHSDIEAACEDLVRGLQIYGVDTAALEQVAETYIAEMKTEHAHITGEDYDTGNSSAIRSGESSGTGNKGSEACEVMGGVLQHPEAQPAQP